MTIVPSIYCITMALIRLRGRADCCAPLVIACNKLTRFSRIEAQLYYRPSKYNHFGVATLQDPDSLARLRIRARAVTFWVSLTRISTFALNTMAICVFIVSKQQNVF